MKTIIVEDQGLVRGFLVDLVKRTEGLEFCGDASDGERAWELCTTKEPDLVILDLELPGIDGLALAERLRETRPRCALLIVTSHREPYVEDQIRKVNPEAWVDKSIAPDQLADILRRLSRKETVARHTGDFPSPERDEIVRNYRRILSEKELEVLRWVSRGKLSKEISEALGTSARTVESHRYNLLRKTGCRNATELVALAREIGLDVLQQPGQGRE